jgi:hypothetical protein
MGGMKFTINDVLAMLAALDEIEELYEDTDIDSSVDVEVKE